MAREFGSDLARTARKVVLPAAPPAHCAVRATVEIAGLRGAREHNGQRGQVVGWCMLKRRCKVQLGRRALHVKPANLQACTPQPPRAPEPEGGAVEPEGGAAQCHVRTPAGAAVAAGSGAERAHSWVVETLQGGFNRPRGFQPTEHKPLQHLRVVILDVLLLGPLNSRFDVRWFHRY